MGAKLLQDVRQDLADVVQVCEGKKKQTNYLRTLINELVKGAASCLAPCTPHSAQESAVLGSVWWPGSRLWGVTGVLGSHACRVLGAKSPHQPMLCAPRVGHGCTGTLRPMPTGILPRSWSHYTVPAGMTVIQWVSDFSERVKQLQNISQAAASGGAKELKVGWGLVGGPAGVCVGHAGSPLGCHPQNIHVCLGGLFVPEAYITATRQYVAQANSWSLEELCLEVNVTTSQGATLDACSFGVTGELGVAHSGPRCAWGQRVPQALARAHRAEAAGCHV